MVLDSSTLTVELVVDDPLGLSLSAVEAALNGLADRSRARSTLGQTGGVAEHVGFGGGGECGRVFGGRGDRTLKSKPL